MDNEINVIQIKNIDDVVIWNEDSNDSFINFMIKIRNENEECTEINYLPTPITTYYDAIHYLSVYCELYVTYK